MLKISSTGQCLLIFPDLPVLGVRQPLPDSSSSSDERGGGGGAMKYSFIGGKIYVELPPWPVSITRTNGDAS